MSNAAPIAGSFVARTTPAAIGTARSARVWRGPPFTARACSLSRRRGYGGIDFRAVVRPAPPAPRTFIDVSVCQSRMIPL
jgi:hypothetical protein